MCLHSHQSSHFTSHLCKRILIFNSEYKVHQWADESASMSLVHLKIGFFLTWIKGGKKGEGGRGGNPLESETIVESVVDVNDRLKLSVSKGDTKYEHNTSDVKKKRQIECDFFIWEEEIKLIHSIIFQVSCVLTIHRNTLKLNIGMWTKVMGRTSSCECYFFLFFKFWSSGICPELATKQLAHLT